MPDFPLNTFLHKRWGCILKRETQALSIHNMDKHAGKITIKTKKQVSQQTTMTKTLFNVQFYVYKYKGTCSLKSLKS